MGPRVGPYWCGEWKISCPHMDSNPRTVQPLASRQIVYAISAPKLFSNSFLVLADLSMDYLCSLNAAGTDNIK